MISSTYFIFLFFFFHFPYYYFFFFLILAIADNLYLEDLAPLSIGGSVGNGKIFYQQNNYFTFANVNNPITVKISYSSGSNYPANLCLNSYAANYPVSGVFLESTCPSGGFAVVSNNTKVGGGSLADGDDSTDDTVSAQVFVKPTSSAGFIVNLPDADAEQNFQIYWEGSQCTNPNQYPVGSNNQCIEIDDMAASQSILVGAGTWTYLRLTLPADISTTDNINDYKIIVNSTASDGIFTYVQEGYIPTEEWYLPIDNTSDDKDQTELVLLTPVTKNYGATYYVGVFNSNSGTRAINITGVAERCSNATLNFGFECKHQTTNTTGTVGGYRTFSATLSNGTASATINNGDSLSYDLSDDGYDEDYAYFKIINYPNFQTRPYYIRVSVANNDISDLSGAPAIFARLGGIPSAQACHYNMSTTGDVAHQLTLPVTDAIYNNGVQDDSNTWFVAVRLPSDFSIWVGVNCADTCDDSDHGSCYCNTQTCSAATAQQTQNLTVYYTIPTNLQDSAGACTCDSKKYDNSFDCSEKNNGNTAIYILLIAIGGFLVLTAGIAAPVYCWYASKKAKKYQEVM